MTPINISIVDDGHKCINTLELLFNQYYNDINILGSALSVEEALPLIEKYKNIVDILFLDIQMPGGDGFTLLQKIPEINFKVIFTTAHDKYALQAIKFSALDYLLKPIDNEELQSSINKFRELKNLGAKPISMLDFKSALNHRKLFEKLAVHTLNEIIFVPLNKILYIESDNHYSTIYLEDNQKIIASKNIGYYEELLTPVHFYRIHNSFLVNIKKIVRFLKSKNGSVELENGIILEVSLRRKNELLELLSLDK